MASITPIQEADLDFDHGTFDSAHFPSQTLASWQALAAVIDHTLLKPDATREQVENLCDEAIRYGFACAMVNPVWASTAVGVLSGTAFRSASSSDFPSVPRSFPPCARKRLRSSGWACCELDMVMPIGQLKSGNHRGAPHHPCRRHRRPPSRRLAEGDSRNRLLTVEEKLRASEIAIQAGADFLKTSTGFSSGGATPADVALLRGVAGARFGVKASGGIRTLADVRAMLEAGANRIGASASVSIVRELGAVIEARRPLRTVCALFPMPIPAPVFLIPDL